MREVEKVIITRPTVSKEEIGFLPGDLGQKMDPWVQPIYQNMFLLYDKVKVEELIKEGKIEIVPVSFMRGRTFVNSVVIVDEAQNVTHEQMEMIVTRIGKGSKMIICGDDAQVDLKQKRDSGFKFLYSAAKRIKNQDYYTCLANIYKVLSHLAVILIIVLLYQTCSYVRLSSLIILTIILIFTYVSIQFKNPN